MLDTPINTITLTNDTLLMTTLGQSLSIDISYFDVSVLQQDRLLTKEMHGRGKVYFFTLQPDSSDVANTTQFALRHYRRGGLMAKLSADKFIYTGMRNTRCYQELSMLNFLRLQHINVPTPIAAKVRRNGVLYSADIITEVVPNANELHELLQVTSVSDDVWHAIGQQIKLMHKLNVCHYDINVKNILIQANAEGKKVYLIDFDKCAIKKHGEWKAQNLSRLKRSILKQQALLTTAQTPYHFTALNWQTLLEGYAA